MVVGLMDIAVQTAAQRLPDAAADASSAEFVSSLACTLALLTVLAATYEESKALNEPRPFQPPSTNGQSSSLLRRFGSVLRALDRRELPRAERA